MSAPTLDEQIACVRREIGLRKSVYPKLVARGGLKQADADRELARMEAVLATLETHRPGEQRSLFEQGVAA